MTGFTMGIPTRKMLLLVALVIINQLGTFTTGLEECIYRADVAVVIDLCQDNKNLWTKTRIFIKDLFDELQIDSDKTRVGTLTSAPEPSVHFHLNAHGRAVAKYMIDSVGRPVGYGDIGATLKLLQNDFYTEKNGERANAPNVVLLFTDGVSFDRTHYNIYNNRSELLLQRPADVPKTTRKVPLTTTKPTLQPSRSQTPESSTPDTNSNDDLETTVSSMTTMTTSNQDDLNAALAQNITLDEHQTRFIIHVTNHSTYRMEKLATFEYHIYSTDDVKKLAEGIRQSSQVDCPTNTGTTESTTQGPMDCDNVPCYGNQECEKSRDNENVVTCECEGRLQSKYCPKRVENFGDDMYRTCQFNKAKKIDPMMTVCAAHISMVCPTYGPKTGGTDIFIWGDHFPTHSEPVVTYLPSFKCDVAFYNSTLIQCKTRHANNFDISNSLLQLQVDVADGCRTTLQSAFHYRPSPKIKDIQPLKITPGGGQLLTIFGQYLDSEVHPRLQVTVTNAVTSKMFASVCDATNDTVIKCRTPSMDLSGLSSNRKKRSVDDLINFSLGMSYEGYNNLSESLPDIGPLEVVKDPVVHKFEDNNGTKTFKPAWPSNERVLIIGGEYFLQAFTSTDYTVRVGKGYCIINNVSSTQIRCVPPSREPKKMDETSLHPEVMVYHGTSSSPVGLLKYDMSPWSNKGFRVGVSFAIVLCIVLIIAAIIYFLVAMKKRQPQVNKKPLVTDERKNIYLVGDYLDPNVDLRLALDAALEHKVNGVIIPREVIQEDDPVQMGNQGMICNGWMLDNQKNQTKELTIKAFKEKGAPFMHIERFLEAAVSLRDCEHKNVMNVLGVVTEKNLPRSVYNHMEYGDLKQHLCDMREKVVRIDFREMLHYCEDAAAGLAYIHDKGIVHEDIAARNCWVDKQNVVKICDSALSPDLYEEEYYLPGEKLRPLPIRWMSPESIVHKVYTFKSDVWSFGVLLWEIMSLGEMPYSSFSDWQIQDHVEKGNRLGKPDLSTVAMYALMTRCWTKDHKKRPTMQEISREMESFIQGEFLNPTLARPPKGKKGGLSVLTTPVVKSDTEYKGKFIKNSVQHDNRAFVPDSPEGNRNDSITDHVMDEGIAQQEDYEAEYEYLKPDLIRMNANGSATKVDPNEVAIDVEGLQQHDVAVDNKTNDIDAANYYANHDAIQTSSATKVDIDDVDGADEVDDADEVDGAYDIPAKQDDDESDKESNGDVRQSGGSDNHDDSYQDARNSIRGDGSHDKGLAALLTGIRASSLEADGYKMESSLSDASVLY